VQGAQEIRFFGKIGFLKSCKSDFSNRVPKRAQEIFLEKSDFSNRAQGTQEIQGAQEIRFFGKISQTVPKVPKKSDWEKSDFSNRAQGAQEIRFF
jgi:hypothetical protein